MRKEINPNTITGLPAFKSKKKTESEWERVQRMRKEGFCKGGQYVEVPASNSNKLLKSYNDQAQYNKVKEKYNLILNQEKIVQNTS